MSSDLTWNRQDSLTLAGVVGLSALVRLWRLSRPALPVFDEIYHARGARELVAGQLPYDWVSPPLSKMLIELGFWSTGSTSAWASRLPSVIAGVGTVVLLYLLARDLLRSREWALVVALMLSLDGAFLVLSRTAMTNVFGVLFQLGALLVVFRLGRRLSTAVIAGLLFGLGLACRWTTVWAWLFGLIFLGIRAWRGSWRPPAGAALTLIVLPLAVYMLSFAPYYGHGRSPAQVLEMHVGIVQHHAHEDFFHPHYSPWYSWPFLVRPAWFSIESLPNGQRAGILPLGNPVLWWCLPPALVGAVFLGWKERDEAALFAVGAFLALWLPWIVAPRQHTFNHYFLEALPYGLLCLCLCLKHVWETSPLSKSEIASVVGLTCLLGTVPWLLHPGLPPRMLPPALLGAGVWLVCEHREGRIVQALGAVGLLSAGWLGRTTGWGGLFAWAGLLLAGSAWTRPGKPGPALVVGVVALGLWLCLLFWPLYVGEPLTGSEFSRLLWFQGETRFRIGPLEVPLPHDWS